MVDRTHSLGLEEALAELERTPEKLESSRGVSSRKETRRNALLTILSDALSGPRTYIQNYTGGRGGE